jgi:hypothetical protein
MSALLLLVGAALAAAPGEAGFVAPRTTADLFRPAQDGAHALAVEDADTTTTLGARAVASHARRPLVWAGDDGSSVDILKDVLAVHLLASAGFGPVQVGVRAPFYVLVTSDLDRPTGGVPGDPGLDIKATLWAPDGAPAGVGVGVLASVTAGWGGERLQLGGGGPSGELGAHGTARLPADIYVLINAGARLQPPAELGDVTAGDRFWTRAAVARSLPAGFGASAEVLAEVPLPTEGAELPLPVVEGLLVGTLGDGVDGPQGRLGLGIPLSAGPGTPVIRLVAGVELRR